MSLYAIGLLAETTKSECNFINGQALACAASTHYLGVIIDQHLTWKLHASYVVKRVQCKLYALNHLKLSPGYLLFQLYQVFVLPIFDYCDVAWAVSATSLSKSLEHLHSRFFTRYFCV